MTADDLKFLRMLVVDFSAIADYFGVFGERIECQINTALIEEWQAFAQDLDALRGRLYAFLRHVEAQS